MLKRLSSEMHGAAEFSATQLLNPIDVAGLARKMWRQRRYMLGGAASAAVLALIYCLTAQPLYTSSSKLLIEPRQQMVLSQQPVGSEAVEAAYVDSQVEVLNSSRVLTRVVKSQELLSDDEFVRQDAGLLRTLMGLLIFTPAPAADADALLNTATDNLRRQVSVKRVGLTYVLSVAATTKSPVKSAAIANAMAEAFLQDNLEARAQAAGAASQWLQGRVGELRNLAVAADARVQEFRAKNNIVATEKGLMSDQQVTEISSQLTLARSQLSEAQARYDKLGPVLAKGQGGELAIPAELPADSIIRKLQQEMIANSVRIAELAKTNGEKHRSVLKLRAENASLAASIGDELARIGTSYKAEVDMAAQRVAALEARLTGAVGTSNATGTAQVELRDLEREAESYRAIYQSSIDKLQEATQQQTFPVSEYRVITPAVPVLQKSWPKSTITIGVAMLAGLALGGLVSLAKAGSDSTMRSARDVADALGGRLLGSFPQLRPPVGLAAAVTAPEPALADPARATKLALRNLRRGDRCMIMGVTSSHRGEGRSTIAAALAASHAASGYRTLLIDADLANPALTTALSAASGRGLQATLADAGTPEIFAFTSEGPGLHFLPAGARSTPAGHDWLAGAHMASLMNFIQERYDAVVIDMAPLFASTDAAAVAPFIDAFVYVVECGKTLATDVERLLEESGDVRAHVAGFVFSKAHVQGARQSNIRYLPPAAVKGPARAAAQS